MRTKHVGQKWRLRYGLLVVGLDGVNGIMVSEDDQRVQVYDGRDNREMKKEFWSVLMNCPLEVELIGN